MSRQHRRGGLAAVVLCALGLSISGCARCSEAQDTARQKLRQAAKASKERARAKRAAKKNAAAEAKVAQAEAKVAQAEKAPHPDFPNAAQASTDGIFLLEEPERGPLVSALAMPDLGVLKWSTHAWCDSGHAGVECGPEQPDAVRAQAHWRVGRRGEKVQIATRRFGPRVEESWVFERAGNGQLVRIVALNRYETVLWSRHFDATGKRYTSRRATGANALEGCGQIEIEVDDRGRITMVGCRQWSGEAMVDTNGVAHTRLERDERGLVSARVRLDKDRTPVDGHDGVHRQTLARDANGRVSITRNFDRAGFPVLSGTSGCYAVREGLDKRGLLAVRTCLDAEDRPMANALGNCKAEFRRDGKGCLASALYWQPGSEVGSCTTKHREHVYEVDHRCARLVWICRDGAGDRVACGLKKPAEYRYQHDARGRVISTKHFDKARQPAGDPACRAFEVRQRWDERGRLLSRSNHGASGEPIECSSTGYHGITYDRDDAGRIQRQRFVGLDGDPGTNLGCAVRHFRYDNYDHAVETRNEGLDGQPIDVLGMAIKRYLYDEGHRDFAMLLFDAKDRPARYAGCFTGQQCPKGQWQAVRVRREANGKVAANLFFDHDAQLLETFDCAKKRCWGD